MTYSKLASKFLPANHYSRGRSGKKICKFTPHYMAGNLTLEGCVGVWVNRDASANYGIDSNGNIACYVQEENRAWTSSSASNDNQAITVEVANISNTTGEITNAAWQSLVRLATDVCHRYNFRLNFTGNPSGSLTMHKMFSSTSCPGPWIESHIRELADTVNKNLDTGNFSYSGTASGSSSSDSSSSSTSMETTYITDPAVAYAAGITGKILFAQEDIYPYIITINEQTPDLDIDKLKSADVVGACIDIGSYFDEAHNVRPTFLNKKLERQFNQFNEKNLAVALYSTVRARNEDEVLKELKEVRLAVLRFPPNSGLWLKPVFYSSSKSVNDKLIDTYYKTLYKLGFNDQVGFYCDKSQMERFDWDKYQDNWYWWMDRHIKDVSKIHQLPSPKFFMYDNPSDEDALIAPNFDALANMSFDSSGTRSSGTETFDAGSSTGTVMVPSGLGTYCTFEKGNINWAAGSRQKSFWAKNPGVDENGMYQYNGRYVIAMTSTFGDAGSMVDIYFRNGKTLHAILGDTKNTGDAGATKWGHDGGRNMVEFIVRSDHKAGSSSSTWYGNVGAAQGWLSSWWNSNGYNSGISKVDKRGSVL